MSPAQVKKVVFENFKSKIFIIWVMVRVLSAFGPLALTYIFSRAINAIELGLTFTAIRNIFILYLVVASVEHLLRIASKTRMGAYMEGILIDIQEDLVRSISMDAPKRKESIQTFRNLTQSLRRLVLHFYDSSVQGVVSFVAIPFILFFIDIRVFLLEVFLIFIYVIASYLHTVSYEKEFEEFDHSREDYYAKLVTTNDVDDKAELVKKHVWDVENLLFTNWTLLQIVISVFQFIIFVMVVQDIMAGTKNISDLVLIAGYVLETKVFLNSVTGALERIMQVKAGVVRIVSVTDGQLLEVYRG